MGKEEEGLIKMLLLILSLHFIIDLHSSAQKINNDVLGENEKDIHKMLEPRELHHIFGTEDVAQVPAYETVHPFTVDENSKRSVNSRRSLHHTDPMFVHFTAFGFDFHLNLTLNKHLVPEGQVIEHHTNDGIKRYIGAPNTYSIGNVVSDDKSIVALDHSNGLSGMIMRDGEMYFMAPAPPQIANNDKPTDGHGAHIIYKKSALPSSHPLKDASCGVQSKGQSNSKDIPERFRRASSSVGSSSARPEKIMELMIVADKSAIVSRGKDFIATYLLALANMVAGFYKDPSLEYPITVAVTRVVLVETDELSFKGDYRLIDKLGKFYSWFMRNNPADDSDPNHVDIGALVTRHPCRINTKGQPKCSNIHGWAAVGRGCGRSTAHSVSLDFGPLSSTTIAHEIGHNLGLPHDGKGSSRTCPSGYIMAANSDAKWSQIWSKCNSRYLNNLLLRPSATTCFDDKPALPVLTNASFQLYGQVFNGQKQCDLQFVGKGYKFYKEGCAVVRCAIRTQIDELDSYLTIHKTQWVAAQGTACNRDQPHHWCIHGECVRDGTKIKAPPYTVNGGWSEYSDYTDCNQQCGGGVQWKERTCTNPRPQHRGKPCKGKAKKYWRRCNMHACTAGMKAPLTRHQRCLAAGCANCRLDPKDPCRLACGKKVLTIYDGSHPTDKSKSRDICIEGSLQKLSCDLTFNHTIPDRCNVCGGDGTTCKRIVGKVDGGKNYHHHLIDFPAGSMNIHVQELGPTKSFLGVKVGDSNDYLYKIPDWSLTKNVAGTKLIYTMKSFNYADQIKIPGTINTKLRLYFYKYTDPSKGVSWTYYTPSGNGNKSSAEYIIGDWGECSKTCAGGIKKRKLGCRRVDDRSPLSLKYCESLPSRKLASTKDCNTHNCPTKWKITRWDKCSKECGGGGEHKRRLLCSELRRDGAYHTVSDTLCKHIKQPKILLKRKCNHMKCPATWAIGRWSQCSKSCGRGTQTRSVSCQRINEDDKVSIAHVHECMALKGEGKAGPKPQSMRACASDTPCPKWTIKYSACSRSCDGGTQQAYAACIRMGTILQESACAAGNKPNVASTPSKTCNTHACNAREWVSKEGTCSVTCGNGIIPITVTCQRVKDNVTVADALCLKSKKPKTTRPCNAGVCVDAYGWKIVKGFCSVTCGKGTTTDRAVCIRKRDTVRVEDTRCVISRKPTVGKAKECTMPKCPETYSWSVTYGPCSSSCGEGVKQPIVKCQKDRDGVVVDDSKCQVFKPQPGMIPCNAGPCPTGYIWKTFWGSCSSKCGKGTQTSYYKCYLKSTQTELSDSYCATITKPAVATKGCSSICRWVPNPDGPCLAKCGKGKKFTTLRCEDESKNELAVKHCSKTPVGTVVLPECTNLKPCIPVAPLVTDVPKFYSVGCYNDNRNSNDRFIPNFIANFRSSIDWKNMLPTIVKCARRVAKVNKKYTYFAIQFYGECYAGDDSVVNRFSRNGPSKNCYMGTGGPHVNFIYRFGSPMQTTQLPAVKPLGCFADNKISPRPLPVLLGNFKTLIKNNGQFDESTAVKIIAECAKAASKRGYKLFGIQSYSECWSGPAAKNTYKKDGLSKSCPLNVGGFKSFYAYIFIS